MENKYFDDAIKELNKLTKQGYFGDKSIKMLEQQSELKTQEARFNEFMAIFEEESNKFELSEYITKFMELFVEGLKMDTDETINIIKTSEIGTVKSPELETLSSYTRYIESNQDAKNLIAELKTYKLTNVPVQYKKRLSTALLALYSDGFEYNMKLLSFVLAILQVANGKDNKMIANMYLSSSQKINQFRQLDKNRNYKLLVDNWDDRLRNADSHNNIRYDLASNMYIGKNNYKNKLIGDNTNKTEDFKITISELMKDLLPKISLFFKGYICATYLIYFSELSEDNSYYKKAVSFLI